MGVPLPRIELLFRMIMTKAKEILSNLLYTKIDWLIILRLLFPCPNRTSVNANEATRSNHLWWTVVCPGQSDC